MRAQAARKTGIMPAVVTGIVAIALLTSPSSVRPAETITGPATVTDGDSLRIAEERIRLIGIDAPERRQTCRIHGREWSCGIEARDVLRQLVRGRTVICDVLGRDRWRRALAVCRAGALELNREMVRRGWALAWYPERAVPGPDYEPEEEEARAARRGIWQGRFVEPWVWRRSN